MQVNQVRLGAVLSYVSMGLSTLISLIYTPIMLGRLGETEYGVYGAVGPIISYLLLLSMGLGSAYIRYYSQAKVAKDRREMAKLNGMFLVTLSLLGLVLLALGFFLAAHPQMVFGTKWAPEELALGAKLLRIMTLNAALSFPFSVFESHVNIHERYLFLKAVTMAKSVLSPLISIPLLLLGFFVGWTHLRINNWLWIAFYSGALLVLSCRRWWVRLLGVGLNLLSLWALTLIVSMGSGQAWLELLWRSILPFLPVTIL